MKKTLITNLVFIDASYLRAIGFDVLSSTMTKFKELCKSGELNLLTTNVTEKENENNIKKYAEELYNDLQKFRKKGKVLDLIKYDFDAYSLKDVRLDGIVTEIQTKLNSFYKECNANIIDLPDNSISTVFDLYFNNKKPFGKGKKKSEFPDAFIFNALSNFAKSRHSSIYVISIDNDFADACSECDKTEHLNSVAKLVDIYNAHEKLSEWVSNLIEKNFDYLEDEIKKNFEYLGFYLEDIYGDVEDVRVVDIEFEDIYIIELEGNFASVSLPISLTFTCEVSYDDPEQGFYDSEDKIWVSFGTVRNNISTKVSTDADFGLYFDQSDEEFFDISDLEVNSNKDIGVRVDDECC